MAAMGTGFGAGRARMLSFGGMMVCLYKCFVVAMYVLVLFGTKTCLVHAQRSRVPAADVQFQEVLASLLENNLTTAATLIQTFVPEIPLNTTLFAPTNDALAAGVIRVLEFLPTLQYHIALGQLGPDQLLSLPVGDRLETLLPMSTLLITNIQGMSLSIDGAAVIRWDICSSVSISCHVVNAVLNSSRFSETALSPSRLPTYTPGPAPLFSPTVLPTPTTLTPSPVTGLVPLGSYSPASSPIYLFPPGTIPGASPSQNPGPGPAPTSDNTGEGSQTSLLLLRQHGVLILLSTIIGLYSTL